MTRMRILALCMALIFALAATGLAEALPEGAQAPDSFTFSGGSGKVTINCPLVWRIDGADWAHIVFSSPNYPTLKLDGVEYTSQGDGETSAFDIPVRLNEDMEIVGTTTAMSKPHDVTYTIHIGVGDAVSEAASEEPEEEALRPEKDAQPVEKAAIEGLTWVRAMPLRYAEGFSVNYYEGDFALIDIVNGDRVLVMPEGAEAPAGLPGDVIVLTRPVGQIYLAATSAMALFDRLDALDAIGMSSIEASDWSVENARLAMESGQIRFAGKYSEPDYELLVSSGCQLAIESTMIFHKPKVREMIEQLGVPVIVDRSSYEPHPLARTEWIKLYAALLGKEAEAEVFFDARAEVIDTYAGFTNTEKRVAFFYISSDGKVVVRSAADYVPKMIEIAGGRYALKDIAGEDSARSSVSTTMEQFYAAAVDADYLIYNASIASPLRTLDDLFALSPLFADFKAVKDGQVWCTGQDFYQETDDVGELIVDIHNMLTGEGEMRFLSHVE